MKAWISSNFGLMTPPTPELSALARLAGIEDMHESLDGFEFLLICNRVTALD